MDSRAVRSDLPSSQESSSSQNVSTHNDARTKQIQALNRMLQAQQLAKAVGGAGSASHPRSDLTVTSSGKVMLQRIQAAPLPTPEQDEISKMAKEEVHQATSKQVFMQYTNSSPVFSKGLPHPADVVEAASLADVPLPPAHYNLWQSLPEELLLTGKLSSLQLEGILYACQRHLTILPDGSRGGFFIGDGAGVGKGRQIAGIILDNYARGRCKHIWFSVSHDLKMDAERDLSDLGCYIRVIDGCQQLDKETKVFGLSSDFKEGIVFSTYATLVSSVQRGGHSKSRLQQLIDWSGGSDFNGCLVFDECHKAKHFVPDNENRSTKIAQAVITIQRLLPKARVVYCSATGVSDVRNLAYMERLGLWGEGMAYKTFQAFLDTITQRGLGAAEMLAMEMKSAGVYVSRGLSFRQAEFSSLKVVLSKEQIQVYDTAAHVWSELKKSLGVALSKVAAPNPRAWATFWGAHQRFFKQLCMSMKVPAIVAEAKKALESGMCVVIGLQTTGESSLDNELLQRDGDITEFISLTKEILLRFISEHFPTIAQTEPVQLQDLWCVAAKDMLSEFVTKMDLPNSPLDDLIDQLGGVGCVAEMTGRKGRIVRQDDSKLKYELRDSDGEALESLNNIERSSFMSGKKLVAIISDAASTGISLHADLNVVNQFRRLHLTMELPWSADKAVQQLGRTHRANQASGPLYQLVTTNLGGERRFASAVAKRLQTLGALTKGDRRAATGVEFDEFNFDTQYGRAALRHMCNAVVKGEMFAGVELSKVLQEAGLSADISLDVCNSWIQDSLQEIDALQGNLVREEAGDVSRFLNRILGLKVHQQNLVFSYFSECLAAVIDIAKKEGRFNEGVTDIVAKSIQLVGSPREVFTQYRLSHIPTYHTHVVADRGVSWEEAVEMASRATAGQGSGFYHSKREQYHHYLHLLAIQKENAPLLFNIIRPNTGRSFYEENKSDLLVKYTPVTAELAEAGWRAQYDSTKDHCIHGTSCKNAPDCTIGSRLTHIHLLSGGILPLLSLLEVTLSRNASKLELPRDARSLRVVRVQVDGGQRIIGVRYPLPLISEVELMLGTLSRVQSNEASELKESKDSCLPLVFKDLLAELETPINRKALSRALNPPVTIRHFFQSKPSVDSNVVAVPPGRLICGVAGKRSASAGQSNKQRKLDFRVATPTTSECPIVIDDSSGGVCTESLSIAQQSGSSLQDTSAPPQSKKCKKSDTDKGADTGKPARVGITTVCPVCGKELVMLTNLALNQHLDICLKSSSTTVGSMNL